MKNFTISFNDSVPKIKNINGQCFDVHQATLKSQKVKNWLSSLDKGENRGEWNIEKIEIHNVFLFGGTNIGYVLAEAKGTLRNGKPLHGINFIRGNSVAILPVLKTEDGQEWTVIVEQPRLAIGESAYSEIPAGMIDEGEVKSKALDELREEIGEDFAIGVDELVEIDRVHPSPGGCDEEVFFYAFWHDITYNTIKHLNGRAGGLESEGESITLRVIPMEELPMVASQDMKAKIAFSALKRYQNVSIPKGQFW